ncbi:hypothetical protein [Ellagibacter sp.]|uniref:hypothetical protein n=1 Tax=Ellagibacter sp. TaxID=2137578 RepID=UPI003AB7D3D2
MRLTVNLGANGQVLLAGKTSAADMPSELSGAAVSHVAQDGCAVMRRTCYEMFKPLLGEAMKTIDAVVLTSGGPIEGVAAARPCWA